MLNDKLGTAPKGAPKSAPKVGPKSGPKVAPKVPMGNLQKGYSIKNNNRNL